MTSEPTAQGCDLPAGKAGASKAEENYQSWPPNHYFKTLNI
jgi:hypothetical protein